MNQPKLDDDSRRVLIAAPFGRDAALLKRVFDQAQLPAQVCDNVAHLCSQMEFGVGAVLVADEALALDALHQLSQCIHYQEPWSDLPVFVMTHASKTEGRSRLQQLEPLGNVTILERPLRSETLVSAFRMGLRARDHQYQLRARLAAEHNAVQALRDSERRYRQLAESLPQLVWTCTPAGDCDYLSHQWIEYTGVPEDRQLRFGWLPQVHPDDRSATEAEWRECVQTGRRYDIEFQIRRHNGEYRWFKTRAVPVRDSSGSIQKWFGSCTDIQEQKQISEERRLLLSREKKARRLAELLNRVGPMLLDELDSEKLAQKVTDLATQLTGAHFGVLSYEGSRALSGLTETNFESLGLPAGDSVTQTLVAADLTADVRSYLATPLVSRFGQHLGSLQFGSSQPDAFLDLHRQLAEGIAAQAAIALDNAQLFTDAQKAQETLRQSNAELRRANDDLNQFAYSASHDLQEPLRMVALYSQMINRSYATLLDAKGSEYLDYVIKGAHRMEMLLRDLLDYTQVVSGHDREEVASSDSNSVFKNVLQNLAKAIKESTALVESGVLPMLAVKEVHLLQLLQNLIGNALKYRSAGAPHVVLSAQREDSMWRLSVTDNGIGIAATYTRQIFGLFKRLHSSNQYEGTGIGLAICQKIVDRYGGRIWVESQGDGKGSIFSFTLPGVAEELAC